MAVLIKVPPQETAEVPLLIEAPKSKAGIAAVGDQAFVWFSEKQGGRGLVGRGQIESVVQQGSIVRFQLGELTLASRWLGNAELGPLRNAASVAPDSSLSKKIYRFAHNRAVALSVEEAAWPDEFIG
ncbi:MAG: hypothetical protein J0J06_08950 [Sphingomonas sp.]|uniref:hypothetical protein n=1 Tax=Sphingomonas sp. TaxID=28214 RepID=UPI001AC2C6E6|nr:hypothetical protein [Sphingomonas sp.]MBN8815559.1 hypothetical protein [Sphingomonas sp.]